MGENNNIWITVIFLFIGIGSFTLIFLTPDGLALETNGSKTNYSLTFNDGQTGIAQTDNNKVRIDFYDNGNIKGHLNNTVWEWNGTHWTSENIGVNIWYNETNNKWGGNVIDPKGIRRMAITVDDPNATMISGQKIIKGIAGLGTVQLEMADLCSETEGGLVNRNCTFQWINGYPGVAFDVLNSFDPPVTLINDTTEQGISTSFTFSHTTPTAINRFLTVGVGSYTAGGGAQVQNITYNGVLMTEQANIVINSIRVKVYTLIAPAEGDNNVIVTMGASSDVIIGAASFQDVDQVTPIEDLNTRTGGDETSTLNINTEFGDLVYDFIGTNAGDILVGANQNELFRLASVSKQTASSIENGTTVGGGSQAMSWSNIDDDQAHVAFNINSKSFLNVDNVTEPTDPATYSPTATYDFTVDISTDGTFDNVSFNFSGTEFDTELLSGNTYNTTIGPQPVGTFTYNFTANILENMLQRNISATNTFTVNAATSSFTALINGIVGDQTFENSTGVNATISINNSQQSVFILRDGVDVTSENDTTIFLNTATYNYTFIANNSANFTDQKQTYLITLTQTSCIYNGAGDWFISCTESCTVQEDTDVLGNEIHINGSGTITINASIINYTLLNLFGNSAVNSCTVNVIGDLI